MLIWGWSGTSVSLVVVATDIWSRLTWWFGAFAWPGWQSQVNCVFFLYRERVIHLLAVRPYKKPELISRLTKGMSILETRMMLISSFISLFIGFNFQSYIYVTEDVSYICCAVLEKKLFCLYSINKPIFIEPYTVIWNWLSHSLFFQNHIIV